MEGEDFPLTLILPVFTSLPGIGSGIIICLISECMTVNIHESSPLNRNFEMT